MTRVYSAADKPAERSAFRQILLGLKMEVVGDPADWSAILTQAPISRTDMSLVDCTGGAVLDELRKACPAALVNVLIIDLLDACLQAVLCTGADVLISKVERPERVAERLRNADPPAFIL
ncbi:MAG TPA: hypothetical protein VKF38_05910 [Anaerolineaceae bacterium]|nr:hypothetical protein [Anaerolineaceae bacterium]